MNEYDKIKLSVDWTNGRVDIVRVGPDVGPMSLVVSVRRTNGLVSTTMPVLAQVITRGGYAKFSGDPSAVLTRARKSIQTGIYDDRLLARGLIGKKSDEARAATQTA